MAGSSDRPARAASAGSSPSRPSEELLAADRRVLLIAVGAMIGLVLVGVLSAAMFTRSACRAIAPTAVGARLAGGDVDEALRVALPDTDDTTRQAMSSALTAVAAQLGPLSGIANVSGATELAAITPPTADPDTPAEAVPGTVAALGQVTTVLDDTGREVAATAELGDAATVTGDGDTLYSLALSNPLTGQVDALLPLDGSLTGQTCVDTATVATPLAFHLDAGDGQLLLYRADEDGDDARLELRDPVAGQVWSAPIEVPPSPPGVMGERLNAVLADDLVVLGRRTGAIDDGDVPVLTAVDRTDGEVVWTVSRDELPDEVRDLDAAWVEVLAVGDEVTVALTEDVRDADDAATPGQDGDATAAGSTQLITLDRSDGGMTGATPSDDDVRVVGAALATDGDTLVAEAVDEGWYVTPASERVEGGEPLFAGFDELVAFSQLDDGRFVALTPEGALVVAVDETTDAIAWNFVGRDVLSHGDHVTLLLGVEDGPGAVAVTFGS